MPFRDPEAGDLATRISAGIRQRIEEAVEVACLDILVNVRRSQGLPAPAADRDDDRAEFDQIVRQLLTRLQTHLVAPLDDSLRSKITQVERNAAEPVEKLMAVQVALARELPDYWQRFDAIRTDYAAERSSGRESSGLFRRLFGRD
jgi:hypothetical protein